MKTEIAEHESLVKLLDGFKKGPANYLRHLAMGMSQREALDLANRGEASLEQEWRQNKEFKVVEDLIKGNAGLYAEEAVQEFIVNLGIKARDVIALLVDKGLNWRSLPQADKPYVMRAIEILAKIQPKRGEEERSYEERLRQGGK